MSLCGCTGHLCRTFSGKIPKNPLVTEVSSLKGTASAFAVGPQRRGLASAWPAVMWDVLQAERNTTLQGEAVSSQVNVMTVSL